MSQPECGCRCHRDEHPRYVAIDGIVVCDWCSGKVPGWNKCETVRAEEEVEEQAVTLEYMKARDNETSDPTK